MASLYRHRTDVLPSTIVLILFLAQLSVWTLVESYWGLILAAATFLSFSACPGSISHNHHHTHTFRRSWMNRIYEVILFFETGVTPYAWTLHHNLGHHKFYLDQTRDPSKWRDKNNRVMGRIRYDLENALKVYPEIFKIGRDYPELLSRFKFWSSVCLVLLTTMFWFKPFATTILFIIPFAIMLIGLLDNTYSQHSGLDSDNHFYASRNTMSRLYNLISWNLGYHTAHHLRPSLHWSKLPEFHQQIQDKVPDGLICNSVFLSACPGAADPENGKGDLIPVNGASGASPISVFSTEEKTAAADLEQVQFQANS